MKTDEYIFNPIRELLAQKDKERDEILERFDKLKEHAQGQELHIEKLIKECVDWRRQNNELEAEIERLKKPGEEDEATD